MVDAGFAPGPTTCADTDADAARCAAAVASVSCRVQCSTTAAGAADGAGAAAASRSRASRAAANDATSLSVEEVTPSHTTSTRRCSAIATAAASSLRGCTRPLSHTTATSGAGCSLKWSRSLGARNPQTVQKPSASISPPHVQCARAGTGTGCVLEGVAARTGSRSGAPPVATVVGASSAPPRAAPHASQNWSVGATA